MSQVKKKYFDECLQWKDNRRKHDIYGNIKQLLGKHCKVEKLMKFLNDILLFEGI